MGSLPRDMEIGEDEPMGLAVIYFVRSKSTKEIVGVFALPENEDGWLWSLIDEVCDAAWCEYLILDHISVFWDRAPTTADYFSGTATLDEASFGEEVFDIIRDATDWKPLVEGWVYFIRSGDFVKIGHALDVERRLAGLQTGAPEPLVLLTQRPGTRVEEAAYHREFRQQRVRGEWFRIEGELARFLREVRVIDE